MHKLSHDQIEAIIADRTAELTETIREMEREISERERFENKLTNASQEWRKTVDATQDIIIMLDNELRLVRVNKAASTFFKKTFHELIGKDIGQLVHESGLSADFSSFLYKGQTTQRRESEFYFPDKQLWVAVSMDPIVDSQIELSGSVLIMRNITEIRHMQESIIASKQQWEDTFDTITDVITIHDSDYNIVRANKAAHRMLKIPDSGMNENIKCFRYYHGTDSPPERCPSCECLKTEKIGSFERFEPHLDIFSEIRAIPRFNDDNKIIGLIHVLRNITDIKTTLGENTKLQNQIIQTQKMDSIGRLAGGVAHDFNNIVSVIIGYSELALKELTEDSILRDTISTIHGAGEKAAALTKKLLAFSRKQVLEMKAVDIESVIESMTKMLMRLIPENVTLSFDSQIEGHRVMADTTQLEQIVMNLVVNARDAMPDGGRLTITASPVEFDRSKVIENQNTEPGFYVLLRVSDTGTGIDREIQDKIFEPFFTTKDVGKGTGMGLATVYGIVKQHNGYIDLHSEPGTGTTFSIYLPVVDREREEIIEQRPERIVTGNETILVVDDEPLLRDMIVAMLEPLGYRVFAALDAEEALKISGEFEGKIDLLLTDVIMPGVNGRKLADILIKNRPGTRVIFISGYTDDVIAHHGVLEEGVVLVQKPITEKALSNKIREVLDADNQSGEASHEYEGLADLHILIADDSEDIRKLINLYLKEYDCHVNTAENGKVAVEKIKCGSYDVVLMDMQMPVMDGLTAVREIRKWEKKNNTEPTTIITLTGNTAQEDVTLYLEAGCNSYLAKPIRKEELINAVSACSFPKEYYPKDAVQEERERVVAYIDIGLQDLIPEYLDERLNDIKKIQGAMQAADYKTVCMMGHTLKGSGGAYGFDPITEIGIHIEQAANEEDPDEIHKWTQNLKDYINNVEVVYE